MCDDAIRTARRSTQRRARPGPRRTGRVGLGLAAALAAVYALTLGGCGGEQATTKVAYADRVLVKKSERKLQLLKNGKVLKEYRVALGANPAGHKMQEGDKRTPVGDYVLDWRKPNSDYHRAIHVSYPNAQDVQLAKALGVSPGGSIMVHGLPNYVTSPVVRAEYQRRDWTNGCIAVNDQEIEEIWRLVRDGTPIRIQE
ncbi:L,D-transpeptidase family protein [Candidatus Thiodictyon syntrophicum]|jgi:murein L,D-transpeptidase YafK|uniref:L,D-TPase catalytic domain-containing protein n=1 Tax=Candidatus Thiodictyon syntrophicum TaxID=1166950 RepID=A0A2K8U6G6_9GAMM|nr:L,D-transpeptidase family protein [Candidatus Thiodictyon syntrophicum]AUB81176.1 hypothetical protein THSYN_09560 [Candidatus Thiodictyon syntrophicum]